MALDPALVACPHCASGHQRTYRRDTREWVHTIHHQGSPVISHTVCLHPPVPVARSDAG